MDDLSQLTNEQQEIAKKIFIKTDQPRRSNFFMSLLVKMRGLQCECCHNTTWLNQPIHLHVHHIDGDRSNNCLDNLMLLCPNCHSYTDNFGSKNIQHRQVTDEELKRALEFQPNIRQALFALHMSDAGANYERVRSLIQQQNIEIGKYCENKITDRQLNHCKICGKVISRTAVYCSSCAHKLTRKVERPSREQLKELIRTKPFITIGKMYGVSDKAITKWCENENLPFRKKDINLFTDEEWSKV